MTHAELRRACKISERWRWRVGEGLKRVEASLHGQVGPGRYCSSHVIDTHFQPSFLELNGVL
jgi:hypothetical protein